MLIFDENSTPVILENIQDPVLTSHMWVLDLSILDYTLSPIIMLEETICSSIQVSINGFDFILPASWNILIYDQETTQLDIIELAEAAGKEFTAFIHGPNSSSYLPGKISITNYFIEHKNVGPSLNKHQLLCHPISETEWINISPTNSYNKYLKDLTISELLH